MDKIKLFYQLEKLINDTPLVINQLEEKAINAVFSQQQTELFFAKNGTYKLKETIIGGKRTRRILVI